MKILLSAPVIFLTAVLTPQLEAISFYPGCASGSLASYEAGGGGSNSSTCALGGSSVLLIDGFGYSGPSGDDSLIQVTPDPELLGGGFTFSGVPEATAGQTLTFDIIYFYTIDPGPVGSGAQLGMDPPTGNVSITESICVDSFFNAPFSGTSCSNGDPSQSLSVNDTNPPTSWTSQIALDPPATADADVEIQIVETGCTTQGCTTVSGFDSTSDNQEISPSTPEPLTSLLGLSGLLAIGLFRRYRR
jgi:hypothetical protein